MVFYSPPPRVFPRVHQHFPGVGTATSTCTGMRSEGGCTSCGTSASGTSRVQQATTRTVFCGKLAEAQRFVGGTSAIDFASEDGRFRPRVFLAGAHGLRRPTGPLWDRGRVLQSRADYVEDEPACAFFVLKGAGESCGDRLNNASNRDCQKHSGALGATCQHASLCPGHHDTARSF